MHLEAHVDIAAALNYLGWSGQTLDDDLTERLDRAIEVCEGFNAQGMVKTFPIASFLKDDHGLPCAIQLVGSKLVLEGYSIAQHLEDACEAALMAVTLGLQSENVLAREAAINSVDGLLVDACASALVEDAANVLSARVAEHAQDRGFKTGYRFGPGYGDFPLSIQRDFLDAIGADKALGMSVTQGDLLVPSKSITAVVGLYTQDGWEEHAEQKGHAGWASASDEDPIVAPVSERDCLTCNMQETCLLHAQGRTCYGR